MEVITNCKKYYQWHICKSDLELLNTNSKPISLDNLNRKIYSIEYNKLISLFDFIIRKFGCCAGGKCKLFKYKGLL